MKPALKKRLLRDLSAIRSGIPELVSLTTAARETQYTRGVKAAIPQNRDPHNNRNERPTTTNKRAPELQAARNHLRRSGWTQAEAARELGVSTVHLCYVLTDRRISKRLLRDIHALKENPVPA